MEIEREITESDVLAFARESGDFSPLHVDSEYAQSTKLGARVVHGAFQIALASAILGMHLPGRSAFLVSTTAQFQAPLYFPCRVSVRGEITAWDAANGRGNLKVIIAELASGLPTSEIYMGFTLHEQSPQGGSLTALRPVKRTEVERKLVLVTGASGGIGSAIASRLAEDYAVLAMVNRRPLSESLQDNDNISVLQADLSGPDWQGQVERILDGNALYGVIHAAWPGAALGGLLSVPRRALDQQLAFAVFHTIEMSRVLAKHAGSNGGRLVALGSIFGSRQPKLGIGGYSLAKASLEHTVRLLAPELAIKQITVNAVCPSIVPTGMNRQVSDRQLLLEKAKVPLGRLCETDDILGAIGYLLSPQASFLSGQTIVLSGGQL